MRAVLDTNVLVAALLSRDGIPATLLRSWHDGAFDLFVSKALLAELGRVLAYPKIRTKVTAAEREEFVRRLQDHAINAADPHEPPPIRSSDAADDYLLALAMSVKAVLVSGDKDLLDLAAVAPIVSPAVFFETLRSL